MVIKKYPLMGKLVVVNGLAVRSFGPDIVWEDSTTEPMTGWVIGYTKRYNGTYVGGQYGSGGDYSGAYLKNRVGVPLLEVRLHPARSSVLCFPCSVREWKEGDPVVMYNHSDGEYKKFFNENKGLFPRDDKGRFIKT